MSWYSCATQKDPATLISICVGFLSVSIQSLEYVNVYAKSRWMWAWNRHWLIIVSAWHPALYLLQCPVVLWCCIISFPDNDLAFSHLPHWPVLCLNVTFFLPPPSFVTSELSNTHKLDTTCRGRWQGDTEGLQNRSRAISCIYYIYMVWEG